MPKSAESNTQIEALRDGETSINKRYRTQSGAVVFTTRAASPLDGWPSFCSPLSCKSAKYLKLSRGGPDGALQERAATDSATMPRGLLGDFEPVACLLRRTGVQHNSLVPQRARRNRCDWPNASRERAHHLVEGGSLVRKAGAVESFRDGPGTTLQGGGVVASAPANAEREALSPQPQVRRQESI